MRSRYLFRKALLLVVLLSTAVSAQKLEYNRHEPLEYTRRELSVQQPPGSATGVKVNAPPPVPSSNLVMPVGIPEPDWDLSLTVADVHGSNDYSTHWIDNTAGNCSDSGNGTQSVPRCTIPSLSALSAGDVVRICGGPYTGSTITIGGSGTENNPIFVRGCSNASRTNFQRRLQIVTTSSYIYVEFISWTTVGDLIFTSRPTAGTSANINHIVLRYSDGTGTGVRTGGSAVSAGRASSDTVFTPRVTDIAYHNVTLSEFGDWEALAENDVHCFSGGWAMDRWWVLYNEAFHCSGDSIQIGHGQNQTDGTGSRLIYIGGNTFHENGENSIDIKQIHDMVISSNNLYGPHNSAIDGNQCIVIHYGPTSGQGAYNVWTINNWIHDCRIAVSLSGNLATKPSYFVGNLIEDLSDNGTNGGDGSPPEGFSTSTGGGAYGIFQNTFRDISGAAMDLSSTASSMDLGGNLVLNVTSHLLMSNQPTSPTSTNDYFYQGGGNVTINWRGTSYTSSATWDAAQAAVTGALNSTVDPLINADGTLQAGSPAINAGMNMSSLETTYQSEFGASLLFDRNGNPRPNGVWDVGAYER